MNYSFRITETSNPYRRILIHALKDSTVVAEFSCEMRCANCRCVTAFCKCSKSFGRIWINPPGIGVVPSHRRKGLALKIYRLADIRFQSRIMPDTPTDLAEGQAFGTQLGKDLRIKYEALYGDWKNDFESLPSDAQLPVADIVMSDKPVSKILEPQK